MKITLRLASALLFLLPLSAHAADGADDAKTGTVHRLSAEEVAAIHRAQEHRASAPVMQADALPEPAMPKPNAVHGEVGFAVGTGGYTSMFGTMVAPLGKDGFVALSLARSTGGHYGPY